MAHKGRVRSEQENKSRAAIPDSSRASISEETVSFRNLYSHPGFADHNDSDFFGAFEKVPEGYFAARMRDYFRQHEFPEPFAFDSIHLTLSEESYQAFLRGNPTLPIKPRDYFLSKLYQYIFLAVREAFDTKFFPDYLIVEALNRIEDSSLPELPDIFSLGLFLHHLDFYRSGAGLEAFLKNLNPSMFLELIDDSKTPEPPPASDDSVQARSRRRQALVDAYKQRAGSSAKSIYQSVNVDRADYYRYLRGELPDSSVVSQRLAAYLRDS